jgi:hypothetical protein
MFRQVDIDSVWDRIEPVASRFMVDPDESSPDDMRDACRAGEWLCAAHEDCLIVCKVKVNPKTDQREFVVWWAQREGEAGAFLRAMPDVRKAARQFACANIVFYSTRPGWFRMAPKAGFRCRNVEWVMPLEGLH